MSIKKNKKYKIPEVVESFRDLDSENENENDNDNEIGDEDINNDINDNENDADFYLPVAAPSHDLVKISDDVLTSKSTSVDPLTVYLREISRYKLLGPDEEQELVKQLQETGDVEVAKKLVLANLRLVVKIAMEYRKAYQNVMDLIQEGNIGLMKAVSKYDPSKGAKLSYYASWWIRSYILKFILDNFRLVKIGTTNEQKKLFYNLLKEQDRLIALGIAPDAKKIAQGLGVSEKAVISMQERLGPDSSDLSLERPFTDNAGGKSGSLLDVLVDSENMGVEDSVAHGQSLEILNQNLANFIENLRPRDKEIFTRRLLSEMPESLQSIASEYGVSRERIRQIEERLLNNLKVYMSEHLR